MRYGKSTPRWKQTFDIDAGIFSAASIAPTKAMRTNFLRGMHGFGMTTRPRPPVVSAFDLLHASAAMRSAEISAAAPALAIAACQRYPERCMRVVFDLPPRSAIARENIDRSSVADRVSAHEGDFFTGDLPAADLYAVGRILHGWNDDRRRRLLRKMADRLRVGGALLVAESC